MRKHDESFTNWPVAGRGAERICYRNPQNPERCIKVSQKDNCKQTLREIKYLRYLERKGVPFSYIPKFYGVVETETLIGMEVQFIRKRTMQFFDIDDGARAPNLGEYLRRLSRLPQKEIIVQQQFLQKVLLTMKAYLLYYNIQACDLNEINILITDRNSILIDGFGKNAWIPLHNYVPFFGRRRIKKKWDSLMRRLNIIGV